MRPFFVLALCLSSFAALADEKPKTQAKSDDSCSVKGGPNDIVKRSGDVTVEAGRVVENVIALKGTVTLKKGAKVKSIISVKGSTIIEDGAEVTESVIAIGGTVQVAPGGVVRGSQLALADGSFSVKGDQGGSLKGDFELNGEPMSRLVLSAALKKLEGCSVDK